MKKYDVRMIFQDDHGGNKYYNWSSHTFSNKKDALWYLRRVNGRAKFCLIRVTDGKLIAHKDGYNKMVLD